MRFALSSTIRSVLSVGPPIPQHLNKPVVSTSTKLVISTEADRRFFFHLRSCEGVGLRSEISLRSVCKVCGMPQVRSLVIHVPLEANSPCTICHRTPHDRQFQPSKYFCYSKALLTSSEGALFR
jgi:hypothetical protein